MPRYKIQCVNDGKIFDTMEDLCKYYDRTHDSVSYRLDNPSNYKDGLNFIRVWDDSDALASTRAIDTRAFVEKFGDQTVPVPGFENHYTISTQGVVTNILSHNRIMPVKTTVNTKHTVILQKEKTTMQTISVKNLMKKAFGDPGEGHVTYNIGTKVKYIPEKSDHPLQGKQGYVEAVRCWAGGNKDYSVRFTDDLSDQVLSNIAESELEAVVESK